MLDAYSAHLTERVRRCAWHKGYVVITHSGGASSVAQTNDTYLHGHLKRGYCEMKMTDVVGQMRVRPRGGQCPRRQDVIGWVACLWSSEPLHLDACRRFLKAGLASALDGTQDAEIVRENAVLVSGEHAATSRGSRPRCGGVILCEAIAVALFRRLSYREPVSRTREVSGH